MKHTKQNHINRLVLCLLMAILTGPLAATAEEPFTGYVKQPTWQQTMLRTRENLRPYLHQLDAIIKTIQFGPWYCTDPIPVKGFTDKAFPEEEIDITATDPAGQKLWHRHDDWPDAKVHYLTRGDPASTYLYRTITTDKAIKVSSGFGSNDGLEVWLNSKKIFSKNVGRTAAPYQDIIDLNLNEGENHLLMKIYNRAGGCGFYFAIQSDPVISIWRMIANDYPYMTRRMMQSLPDGEHLTWLRQTKSTQLEQNMIKNALVSIESEKADLKKEVETLIKTEAQAYDQRWLDLFAKTIEIDRDLTRNLLDAPLLFVKRQPYDAAHIYDDYIEWHPGGGIYIIENPAAPIGERKIRPIIDPATPETLGVGVYRDPDLSWDGQKIVFAFKGSEQGDTSIYEIRIDGTGLRRLTQPGLVQCSHGNEHPGQKCTQYACTKELPVRAIGKGWHDITPAYLPDGRIVFTSTRPAGRVPCFNSSVDTLHIMDPDGKNVRCISVNNVNEFDPAILPDGRILFGRWEYVDKTALYMQSLWTIFPDGTNETALFANNLAKPTALLDARAVPNSNLVVTALTPHNGQAVGAIAVIDPRLGKNDLNAVTNFTPKYPTEMDQGLKRGPSDPWAISKDYVLIANNDPENGPHGVIELISRFGHRELVHSDPEYSCYSPILIKPRPAPGKIADITAPATEPATFFVRDIYRGLTGVSKGQVKSLRIIEETTRVSGIPGGGRWWNQAFLVSWQGAYTVKNILGTVPVHPDGSAYFEAPPGRALYFSALDENGAEIQRMRTFVKAAPGVTRSCIGCHETKMSAPANHIRSMAHNYPPAKPKPESWGSGFVDYPTMIQPILDEHCVSCHGGQQGIEAGIDLSGGWTWAFNISYETLIKNTLVGFLNCHNSSVNTSDFQPPGTYGSGAAPLTQLLLSDHKDRIPKLTKKQHELIFAWMDTNSNYYGSWNWSKYATCNQIFETAKALTETMEKANCTSCHEPQIGNDWINLRQPELSRILRAPLSAEKQGFGLAWCRARKARKAMTLVNQSHQPPDVFNPKKTKSPDPAGNPQISFASTEDTNYQKMLQIIQQGRQLALAQARVDMPGAKINPGLCRYLVPLSIPEQLPPLKAKSTNGQQVQLSWKRSAETIGLTFELHRADRPNFNPSSNTLSATTT
ncbi:MAG: HzsA-related protein, partial [Planctomycetota bacterium]